MSFLFVSPYILALCQRHAAKHIWLLSRILFILMIIHFHSAEAFSWKKSQWLIFAFRLTPLDCYSIESLNTFGNQHHGVFCLYFFNVFKFFLIRKCSDARNLTNGMYCTSEIYPWSLPFKFFIYFEWTLCTVSDPFSLFHMPLSDLLNTIYYFPLFIYYS